MGRSTWQAKMTQDDAPTSTSVNVGWRAILTMEKIRKASSTIHDACRSPVATDCHPHPLRIKSSRVIACGI
eukprot:8760800-Alexandrium_andersonii.AAC.1